MTKNITINRIKVGSYSITRLDDGEQFFVLKHKNLQNKTEWIIERKSDGVIEYTDTLISAKLLIANRWQHTKFTRPTLQ